MDFQEFVKEYAVIDLSTAERIAKEGFELIRIVNEASRQGLEQKDINKILDTLFSGSGKFSVQNNMSRLIWFVTQSAFETNQPFGRGGVVLDIGSPEVNVALFKYFQTNQQIAYPRASSHMTQYRQEGDCMGMDIDTLTYANVLLNNQDTHNNNRLIPLPIQKNVRHPFVTVNFILVNESGVERIYLKSETAPWNPSKNPMGSLRHAKNYLDKKLSPKNIDGLVSKREDSSEAIENFASLRKEIVDELTRKYLKDNASLSNLSWMSSNSSASSEKSWVSISSSSEASESSLTDLRRSLSGSLFKYSGKNRKTKLVQILKKIESAKNFDKLIEGIQEMRDVVRSTLKGGSDRSLMYMRPIMDAIKKTEELKHRLSSPNLHGNEVRILVNPRSGKVSCGDSHSLLPPKTAFFNSKRK